MLKHIPTFRQSLASLKDKNLVPKTMCKEYATENKERYKSNIRDINFPRKIGEIFLNGLVLLNESNLRIELRKAGYTCK